MLIAVKTCKKTFELWFPSISFLQYFTQTPFPFASRSSKCAMERHKPPNIFVYTGQDDPKSFAKIKTIFQLCLNPEQYVIYHLLGSKIWKIPWQDNTLALVVSCQSVPEPVQQIFKDFTRCGGKILSLCSNVGCNGIQLSQSAPRSLVTFSYSGWANITTYRGAFDIVGKERVQILGTEESSSLPVIVKSANEKGTTVVSQVHLTADAVELSSSHQDFQTVKKNEGDCLRCLKDILSNHLHLDCSRSATYVLTPAHLIPRSSSEEFVNRLRPQCQEGQLQLRHQKLKFVRSLDVDKVDPTLYYPVIMSQRDSKLPGFSPDIYFENLKTRHLGALMIFSDTITSTMDLIEGFPINAGVVVLANIQTKGKGRSGNVWLSPRGCAMFSVQVCVDRDSPLGQSLSIVQQLATLAVIKAIKNIPGGYQDLDLGLKWPNDLYYAGKVKFGGILANTTMQGNAFHCYLGFGVNLSNSQPTGCLNDFIELHNKLHATQMEPLCLEHFVASVINQLEEIVDLVQEQGTRACLVQLYQHWIHSDQKLMLDEEEVVVEGMDQYGFLLVKTLGGKILTLHPDGNSLDQMKNLIIVKK